jgi:hypothetical protein
MINQGIELEVVTVEDGWGWPDIVLVLHRRGTPVGRRRWCPAPD